MPRLSKSLKLRIPSTIIYHALKDTRLETLFPEFFIGVERKVITDIINKEICFNTITQGKQIEINETFKFKISDNNETIVEYLTEVKSVEENNIILEIIVQTHIANILYSLLMLETGYINGVLEKKKIDHLTWKRKKVKIANITLLDLEYVKSIVNTDSCQAQHTQYVILEWLKVVMNGWMDDEFGLRGGILLLQEMIIE